MRDYLATGNNQINENMYNSNITCSTAQMKKKVTPCSKQQQGPTNHEQNENDNLRTVSSKTYGVCGYVR